MSQAPVASPHVALTKKRLAVDPAAPKVCCVYKFTCIKNGKAYIGQTVQPLEKYFRAKGNARNSNTGKPYPITRAIEKHGRKGFRIEILCVGEVEYCRDVMEAKLIAGYGTRDRRHGYNISEGGEGWSSADVRRWYKTPEGRKAHAVQVARAAEVNARLAGYPSRRVLAELKKGPRTADSLVISLGLTRVQVTTSLHLPRSDGQHIIWERASGLYRLGTLEEAAEAWASSTELTNPNRIVGLLMEGPRTADELGALVGLPSYAVRINISSLRKGRDFTVLGCKIKRLVYMIESRGARGGHHGYPGTYHLIQDEHHPWLHCGMMDLRGAAHDDRE